jgi:hypothetical protein
MQKPEVCRMTSEIVVVEPSTWGRRGTNDQSIERIEVHAIIDREGNHIEGVWGQEWAEAGKGVETRLDQGLRTVRIHRSACPVSIEMQHNHEYLCYDDSSLNSSGSTYYWVRYVT